MTAVTEIQEDEYSDLLPAVTKSAERTLVGSLILAPERVADVAAVITGDDFLDDNYRNIFEAVRTLATANKPVDTVTLASLLTDRKQFDNIGGYAGIGEVMMASATGCQSEHYAEIVLERSRKRKMLDELNRARHGISSGSSFADTVSSLQANLESLAGSGMGRKTMDMADLTRMVTEEHEIYDELPTGWENIDALMCGGLTQSSLTIVAGAPSVGKSQFGIHMAHNVAKAGTGVLYIVQEMGCEEVYDRLAAIEAGINSGKARQYRRALATGDINGRITHDYFEAMGRLKDLPIHIHAHGAITPAEYSAILCRYRSKIGLVILDYLQQVKSSHPKQTDFEKVNEISALCKSLAARYRLPSVALAQFNREGYKDGGKPTMAHLRQSGQIEQDADNIFLLWRERENEEREDLEVNVVKQRNGATKKVILEYSLNTGRMKPKQQQLND